MNQNQSQNQNINTNKNSNKKQKKFSVLKILRWLLQIAFLLLLPALYIGTLSGIQQIYQAVIHQSFSAALLPSLIEVIAIVPVTILLGRFFCGWMCAFGSFTDFIYYVFHKAFPKKWKVNEQADKWMKFIKYGVLGVLVVAVWSFGSTAFSTASPWDAFGMLLSIGKMPDFSYVISNLTIGFVILVGITIASALVERFFCRYLCPMGAIFAIVSKLRIAKIKKPSEKCGKCRICTNSCAMGIPLYKMDSVSSGECINCMKCVSACPRANTTFTIAQKDVRPLMAGVASAAIISGMYYAGDFTLNTGAQNNVDATVVSGQTSTPSSSVTSSKTASSSATSSKTASSSTASSKVASSSAVSSSSQVASSVSGTYKDGTYQGSGIGFKGTTSVSVVVSGGKITNITVNSYRDDRQYFQRAFSTIYSKILSSQSAKVDTVSGATFSSDGIIAAVANALSKA